MRLHPHRLIPAVAFIVPRKRELFTMFRAALFIYLFPAGSRECVGSEDESRRKQNNL
jgi:hypothetical protein